MQDCNESARLFHFYVVLFYIFCNVVALIAVFLLLLLLHSLSLAHSLTLCATHSRSVTCVSLLFGGKFGFCFGILYCYALRVSVCESVEGVAAAAAAALDVTNAAAAAATTAAAAALLCSASDDNGVSFQRKIDLRV